MIEAITLELWLAFVAASTILRIIPGPTVLPGVATVTLAVTRA